MNKPIAPLVHYWINTYYGAPQCACDAGTYRGEPLDTSDGVTCSDCNDWVESAGY